MQSYENIVKLDDLDLDMNIGTWTQDLNLDDERQWIWARTLMRILMTLTLINVLKLNLDLKVGDKPE